MALTNYRVPQRPGRGWPRPAACSAATIALVTIALVAMTCTSAGPLRLAAGLGLLATLAGALWLVHQARLHAIVPAIGLTLVFLILAGLALAAVHLLATVPTALAVGVATLAAAWASVRFPVPSRKSWTPRPLAIAGVAIFAVAAVLADRYAAASEEAAANSASSLAVWAYPAAEQLHVGAQQPAGHGTTSLRIVVTQAGMTAAAWNNVRLAPGQAWEAPALTLTGSGPVQVTVLRGGTVVARLSTVASR